MDPIWLANKTDSNLPDLSLLDSNWQFFLITIYTTSAIISLASNIVTIIVLIKGERLSSEIWKYLINLSVADLSMALFCIPFTYTMFMLGHWIFPIWLCPVVQFTQVCSVLISVYTLTIIGIDRYFAIVYPFQQSIYLKSHKKLMLSIVWIIAIGIGLISFFKTTAVPFPYGNETYYDCRELWDSDEGGKNYTLFIFILTFALPISILTFVYTSICWYILRHNTPGNPDRVRDLAQWKLKIKVVKMLITIVILFALCWLPIHVFNIIVWFFPPKVNESQQTYMIYVFSYFFCHFLSMSHSFINPFVYGFMSENFKLSLRRLFTRIWNRRKHIDTEMDKLSTSHNTQEITRLNSNSLSFN